MQNAEKVQSHTHWCHRILRHIDNNCLQCLTLLVWRQEGHPACKKTQWFGAGMVICLERGADLHMAQLTPLPLTVSCSSKIQIGFTFLVEAHHVCVCVCVITTRSRPEAGLGTLPPGHRRMYPRSTHTQKNQNMMQPAASVGRAKA